MITRLPTAFLLLPLFTLLACDDDPIATGCDAPHGCEIEGIDVAILEADLRFDDSQPFEDEVDAHVVEPGSELVLRVRVVNRGTEASGPTVLRVVAPLFDPLATAAVPALDPGEERTLLIDVTAPEFAMWGGMLYQLGVVLATDSTTWYEDADFANNYAPDGSELEFHPLVPIFEVDLNVPDTIRSLEPHILSATIHNRSPFVASIDVPFGVCIYPGNPVCDDQPDGPLGSSGVVLPGESRVVPVGVVAPMEWGVDLNHPEQPVSMSLCFLTLGSWESRACVWNAAEVVLMPNLAEECAAPLLVPPTTFDAEDASALCELVDGGIEHFIWSLDAEAGDAFRFTAQAEGHTGIQIHDVEGREIATGTLNMPFEFTAPRSERYYLVTGNEFGEPGAPILVEAL